MDFLLKNLPERTSKPRETGFTMAMDKGMSPRETEDFLNTCGNYVDVVKLGWATGYVSQNLKQKLEVLKSFNMPYYFGGTLFEAFVVRGQFDDYCRFAEHYGAPYVEVSNGSMDMTDETKAGYIRELAKHFTVLAEVGSKDETKDIPPYQWVEMMKHDLEAGAFKVIAEARESGTVGVYGSSGKAREGLVAEIIHHIPEGKILWEAPLKPQQVWFIKLLGSNVNLGNIAPSEVIPLETLRLGLRGDTFSTFLK